MNNSFNVIKNALEKEKLDQEVIKNQKERETQQLINDPEIECLKYLYPNTDNLLLSRPNAISVLENLMQKLQQTIERTSSEVDTNEYASKNHADALKKQKVTDEAIQKLKSNSTEEFSSEVKLFKDSIEIKENDGGVY